MGPEEIIGLRREEVLRVAARHGVVRLRVFGSVARGDARPDSDLDLLVEVGPDHSPFFPGGLVADLEELLGRRVQVVEEATLRPDVRRRILCEAVAM